MVSTLAGDLEGPCAPAPGEDPVERLAGYLDPAGL